MSKGTAPAWQVRDIARGKVFEQIKRDIASHEDDFDTPFDLYRLVLRLIDTKLCGRNFSMSLTDTLPNIPWATRKTVYRVLTDADATIWKFRRTPAEGLVLWVMVFEWAAAQIGNFHIAVLEAMEITNPLLVFGVADRTTEVPIE